MMLGHIRLSAADKDLQYRCPRANDLDLMSLLGSVYATHCPPECLHWQGNPDEHRRNYSGLLEDIKASPSLINNARFELDIFAWDELDPAMVPDSVAGKLFYKHLRYTVSALACQPLEHLSMCEKLWCRITMLQYITLLESC